MAQEQWLTRLFLGIITYPQLKLRQRTLDTKTARWQRRILSTLSTLFPNIQFIITTHSPQVLGEAGERYNIYSVSMHNRKFEARQLDALDGWSSNEILEELMDTSEVSDNARSLTGKTQRPFRGRVRRKSLSPRGGDSCVASSKKERIWR